MATRDQIITYIYDLKDKVTGKLRQIVGASKDQGAQADKTAEQVQRSNDKIGKSYDGVGSSLGKLRGILGAVGIAFSFDAIKDGIVTLLGAGDAAERTKIQLAALYGTQEAGNKAFDDIRALAKELGVSFDSTREAAIKLKAAGLEPLDGTLKAVINQNALLGGSQETLTGISLALAQAYSKQKLQTEEILQLVERGVPAFDLLAKVTGKSGAELQKLIESGKLGRVEIKGLIDEIGRASDGAAAASINTLGSLVTQLKDQFTAFLERIANSGAADFFKQKLKGIRDEIELMVNDGRLQKFAEDTSNSITQIGEVVSAVAAKWRVLTAASDAAIASVTSIFKANAVFFTEITATVTGAFNRLTGAGEETAKKFERLDQAAKASLLGTLKQGGDAADSLAKGFGLVNDEGGKLGGTFASVKSGADSTASAFRNVKSGSESTAVTLIDMGKASDYAKKKAVELADAYKTLNVKSSADLQDAAAKAEAALNTIVESYKTGGSATAATTADVANAFEQYAAAQRATVADAKEWEKAQVEGALNAKAALLGLSDIPPPQLPAPDVKEYTGALQSIKSDAGAAGDSLKTLGGQATETSGEVGNAAQAIQNIYAGFANDLAKTSEAAVQQFTKLSRQIFELSAGIADFSGLARYGKAAEEAYNIINGKIEEQKQGVAGMAAQYADLSDAAVQSLVRVQGSTEDAVASLQLMAEEARNGKSEFDLLGQADLAQLAAAADAAAAKVKAIGDAAKAAKEQFADLAASLQDELDRKAGNDAAVEKRRYEQQLEDIRRLAEETGTLNSAEYQKAVANAKKLHEQNLRDIAAEKKARDEAKRDSPGSSGSGGGTGGGGNSGGGSAPPKPAGSGGGAGGTGAGGGSAAGGGRNFTITITGAAITQELAREIKKIIEDIDRRGR